MQNVFCAAVLKLVSKRFSLRKPIAQTWGISPRLISDRPAVYGILPGWTLKSISLRLKPTEQFIVRISLFKSSVSRKKGRPAPYVCKKRKKTYL